MRGKPLVVLESETVAVDRDEVCSGRGMAAAAGRVTAIAPGMDPKDTEPLLTALTASFHSILQLRTNQRTRLRFINGCQRHCYRS